MFMVVLMTVDDYDRKVQFLGQFTDLDGDNGARRYVERCAREDACSYINNGYDPDDVEDFIDENEYKCSVTPNEDEPDGYQYFIFDTSKNQVLQAF